MASEKQKSSLLENGVHGNGNSNNGNGNNNNGNNNNNNNTNKSEIKGGGGENAPTTTTTTTTTEAKPVIDPSPEQLPTESNVEYLQRLNLLEQEKIKDEIKQLESGSHAEYRAKLSELHQEKKTRQHWLEFDIERCQVDIEDGYVLELQLLKEAMENDIKSLKDRIEQQFLAYEEMLEDNGAPTEEDIRADLLCEDRGVGQTPIKPVRKRVKNTGLAPTRRKRKPTTPVHRLTNDQQQLRLDEVDDDMRGFQQYTGRIRRPTAQRFET